MCFLHSPSAYFNWHLSFLFKASIKAFTLLLVSYSEIFLFFNSNFMAYLELNQQICFKMFVFMFGSSFSISSFSAENGSQQFLNAYIKAFFFLRIIHFITETRLYSYFAFFFWSILYYAILFVFLDILFLLYEKEPIGTGRFWSILL